MSGKIEQGLHEKLCAYVLGEIDGADRAEVERELLRSPELRAERERLEGTIGAVRDAMKPAQTLTPGAKEALERAVRPSPIAQFPWLRIAAGIGAVGLGWWIFAQGPGRKADVMVARSEVALESDAERSAGAQLIEGLGYAGATKTVGSDELAQMRRRVAPPPSSSDARADQAADGNADKNIELGEMVGNSEPTSPAEITRVAPTAEAAAELVATQGAGSLAVGQRGREEKSEAEGTAIGIGATGTTSSPSAFGGRMMGSGARRAHPDGPTVPSSQGAPVVAEDMLVVQDSGRWRDVSSRKPLEFTAIGSGKQGNKGGTFHGPGDVVPPGGGGGGTGPSSPGPSSPGPSGPSTGGPAGPNGFVGATPSKSEARRLNDLGYPGGDDEDDVRLRRAAERQWNELPPAEQARQIELRYGRIVEGCFPRPNERPRDMFFRFWGDNPFEVTLLDKLSTFSADVDTASYALARRYLNEGKVPEKAQVRTEEFVNYFASGVEAPRNATFSVHSDLTPSRFSSDSARQMLRVVVRAKDVDKTERQPMHLTFVVDVSGSMKEQNRLETVKHALRMLVAQLDGRDSIAIVSFSDDAKLVLPMTPVVDRAAIEAVIAPLRPLGSTNSNAGLQLGYAQALDGLDPNAINRVVFLADGVANVGETDATKILEGVRPMREKGIFLNTIGVGMNNHNDVLLEQLADKGDGLCNYVDSPKEIQRALVDRFTGAFQPIAKDVKIQVEFDPQQVMRYRLLGYENRAIADADFRNDAVDAGELGAGHQVTALYEIEPTGRAGDGPMATVRLRWKPIRAAGQSGVQEATEASFEVNAKSYQAFEASPPGHRRALIVAQFAEILRRSIHARGESLGDLVVEAERLQAQIPNDKDFAEFTALASRARATILNTVPVCDELCQTVDAYRSNAYLGAVFHETGRDAQSLAEIEKARVELERRLREVLRRQAEGATQKLNDFGYSDGKK